MKKPFLIILATLLLIEEWLWDVLNQLSHLLIRTFNWQGYENWLKQCSPLQALFCFFIPLILITPLNLLALKMLTMGLVIQGIALEIGVKLFATLFISRIFSLTKNQLLTYRPIERIYTIVTSALGWAHSKVAKLYFYQKAKQFKAELLVKIQQWPVYPQRRS